MPDTLLAIIASYFFIVLTQDVHIFPGVIFSQVTKPFKRFRSKPLEAESIFISTEDNKSIELWRIGPDADTEELPYVAVIFHGNGASMKGFLAIQLWLSSLGIISYGFDYRGFGNSTGWPSERGLELDSDAVWKYITTRENILPEQMIVLGISIGGALAARIASLHEPKVLILVSAFTNLRQAVVDYFPMGIFAPLLKYRLPTIDYVGKLKNAHLITAHGERDRIVRPYHTEKIMSAYHGSGTAIRITRDVPGHNSIFFSARHEIAEALKKCMQ
ncbi:MAG: alpha/beta fold hydrolase [bacterium]|nr:alpha/beta fold hydrolase [bacterium]